MAISLGDLIVYLKGDDTQLQATFKKATESGKTLGSKIGKSLKTLGGGFEKLGKKVRNVGIAMTALGGAAVVGGAKLVKSSMDFEKGFAEVLTLLSDTDRANEELVESLRTGIKSVSADYGIAMPDAVAALYQSISRSIEPAEAIQFIGKAAKGSIGGVASLTETIDAVAGHMTAFGVETKDVDQVLDSFFVTVKDGATKIDLLAGSAGRASAQASAMGVSMDEYNASIAALTQVIPSTSQAVTGLQGALTAVRKPSKEASEMADALGIEWNTAAIQAKGFVPWLDEIQKTVGEITPGTAKYAKLQKQLTETMAKNTKVSGAMIDRRKKLGKQLSGLKRGTKQYNTTAEKLADTNKKIARAQGEYNSEGKKAKELLDKLNAGTVTSVDVWSQLVGSVEGGSAMMVLARDDMQALNDVMDDMSNKAGASDKAFEELAKTTAQKWAQMKASLHVLAIEMGDKLIPIVTEVVEEVKPLIKEFSAWIKKNDELIKQKVGEAATAIAKGIGNLIRAVMRFMDEHPKFMGALMKWGPIAAGIGVVFGPVLIAVGSLVSVFGSLIGLLPILGTAFTVLTTGALGVFMGWFVAFVAVGGAGYLFGGWINDMIDKYIPSLGDAIDKLSAKFVKLWEKIKKVTGLGGSLAGTPAAGPGIVAPSSSVYVCPDGWVTRDRQTALNHGWKPGMPGPSFQTGGIVGNHGGTVEQGEMVLNKRQQEGLFGLIQKLTVKPSVAPSLAGKQFRSRAEEPAQQGGTTLNVTFNNPIIRDREMIREIVEAITREQNLASV